METKAPWTETALYYVLWAISTFLILGDILALRRGIQTLVAWLLELFPPRNSADDPAYILGAVDLVLWLVLIAAGLAVTILIEYHLRRAGGSVHETSGAPKESGPKRMLHTALVTWAWEIGVVVLGLAIDLSIRLFTS
ncbi:MAG: hypothetical protein ABFD20_06510 [Anaerolineales bacterium]